MDRLEDWIGGLYLQLSIALGKLWEDEKGDTNFISIMILLGIAIGIAGAFIIFKNNIIEEVQGIINGFTVKDGGAGGGTP